MDIIKQFKLNEMLFSILSNGKGITKGGGDRSFYLFSGFKN